VSTTGKGPVLLVMPEDGVSFEAWRMLEEDPTVRDVTFEGFYELLFHSKAYVDNEWLNRCTNPNPNPNPNTNTSPNSNWIMNGSIALGVGTPRPLDSSHPARRIRLLSDSASPGILARSMPRSVPEIDLLPLLSRVTSSPLRWRAQN